MGMIPIPISITLVTLFLGVLIFILIMLLPALIELKIPKDAGPRMIMENPTALQKIQTAPRIQIQNMEKEFVFDRTIVKKIAEAIAILPNLET
jgi:hypothetical protein